MPRPSSPVHAKASTNCPYLTLENPHHQRQFWNSRRCGAGRLHKAPVAARTEVRTTTQLDKDLMVGTRSPKATMPPRHRFLEPIHNVKDGGKGPRIRGRSREMLVFIAGNERCWWSQPGSNRRPQACKASALPTELWPHGHARMLAKVPRTAIPQMVGRVGVEPTTSRLSGVRSNHLSYRPPPLPGRPIRAAGGVSQLRRAPRQRRGAFPVMKGHEDGGYVLWKGRRTSETSSAQYDHILRKEVIQPQVPLRLPCYDFTPVAKPTVVACLPYGLAQRLRVNPTPMV